MTFSYEKYLFSPQAKQWWENVPKHLKITKSPRKIILGDFVLMLGYQNSIDAGRTWGPTRWGGAFAPYKRFGPTGQNLGTGRIYFARAF